MPHHGGGRANSRSDVSFEIFNFIADIYESEFWKVQRRNLHMVDAVASFSKVQAGFAYLDQNQMKRSGG